MHVALRYIWHWLTAVNEHSLHSPFLFDFYQQVIKYNADSPAFAPIERLRENLISANSKIEVRQLGANSRVNNKQLRPVSAIAKKGLSSSRTSKLLYAIIHHYNYRNIIELGTSFGINSLYLAANPATRVVTFEGCPNTTKIAKDGFAKLNADNIELIQGNINETLIPFCQQYTEKIDLAFIDANHQYKPTITYFEQLVNKCHKNSLIIIDDIYWSKEMIKAWEEIKNHPRTIITIDLFKAGIVFLNPELSKGHYKFMF